MMEPLPSSPIDPGWMTAVDPSLQRTVAVAPMRTMIITTAGLARKTADWSSDSVAASDTDGKMAARRQASPAITRARAVVEMVPSLRLLDAWTRPRGLAVRGRAWGLSPDHAAPCGASLPRLYRRRSGSRDHSLVHRIQGGPSRGPQHRHLTPPGWVVRNLCGLSEEVILAERWFRFVCRRI